MNATRHLLIAGALGALLLGLLACGGREADPGPGAKAGDLESALALAGREGTNVVVEWTSRECGFSRKMNGETLADAEVKRALEDGVVHVRFVKEEEAAPFTSRFGDAPTPSFVVLRPDGTQVGRTLSGFVGKSDFLWFLDWARTGEGPEPGIQTGGS